MNETVKPTVRERAREEFRKYAMVSIYLWICFAVITLYRASVLEQEGIDWAPLASLLGEIAGRPLWVTLAPVLLMLLILVPMITAAEIHRTVGAERFRALWLG
jgi:hypothetical protein